MNGERCFCPFCGRLVSPVWQHCAACGRTLESSLAHGTEEKTTGLIPTVTKSLVPRNERRWNEVLLRLRLGELDKAGMLLSEVISETPRDAQALALLGSIRLRQRRIAEAQRYLDQAVLMAPHAPFVHFKLAEYWLALGVPSRALAELDEAEAAASDDLDLVIQIRAEARKVRAGTRGSILLEPPALSGIFRRTRSSLSAV
jgi:predicted Zn-dependent protease